MCPVLDSLHKKDIDDVEWVKSRATKTAWQVLKARALQG